MAKARYTPSDPSAPPVVADVDDGGGTRQPDAEKVIGGVRFHLHTLVEPPDADGASWLYYTNPPGGAS